MQLSNESRRTGDRGPGMASPGLNVRNFRKISPNGFGDPYNAYPHSMVWFMDHLYVGTTRACLAHRGRWRTVNKTDWLGKIWAVKIPENTFDIDLRSEIWRYHPPTDRWTRVFRSPFVKGADGYDVPLCVALRTMAQFQGKSDQAPALYVPTMASHQTGAAVMLRSADGINFDVVSEPGMGFPDPYKPRGVRALISFKGHLLTAPAVGQKRMESNTAGFMVIGVNDDPARAEWKLACEPGFGDPNNLSVFDMAVFNGALYAGTLNVNDGFQVWKTYAEGEPPFKWTKIITNGAYRGKLNQIAIKMYPFGDHLYVGSAIQEGGYNRENNVGPAPPEIIRISPDGAWELVVGEPRLTPDGLKVPLSAMSSGMENNFAGYLWSMCSHDGWLYAGTFDWLMFLRYGRTERVPEHIKRFFSTESIERMIDKSGGCDLWRSRDGLRWVPVTLNGFGNYFNFGVRNMVSTPKGLIVGLTNPFAPEVAVRRAAGWNYEYNPRGGLEIWMGSLDGGSGAKRAGGADDPVYLTGGTAKAGDEEAVDRFIEQFYANSGFSHFGYWQEGIKDAGAACENLMNEVMAFIPEKKGAILDIGCGTGATTSSLLKYYPAGAITGVTARKGVLDACRAKAPGVTFVYSKLPRLCLPDGTFDSVIWVKGLNPLASRRGLLGESFRVLRPGGMLACFDVLYDDDDRRGFWDSLWSSGDDVKTIDEYRAAVQGAGFEDIRIVDVTAESLDGFKKHVARYLELKKLRGDVDDEFSQEFEGRLIESENQVSRCLLISGRKPSQRLE